MDELKPCPFCGSDRVEFTPDEDQLLEDTTTGFIWCHGCDFSSDNFYNPKIAAEKWNRRAAPENKPLTLDYLRTINADMQNRRWVWIEVLKPFDYECKVSAYYQVQADYTQGEAFVCGYPGLSFGFDYADYGKTWLAYARKPENQ